MEPRSPKDDSTEGGHSAADDLRLPDFDPAVIFCEVTHVDPASLDQLTQQLQGRGYHLGRATSEMTEDGFGDLVAWK